MGYFECENCACDGNNIGYQAPNATSQKQLNCLIYYNSEYYSPPNIQMFNTTTTDLLIYICFFNFFSFSHLFPSFYI